MKTRVLNNLPREGIREAAQLILQGELVAFPTETVYGLGGNALSAKCAEKIYSAKGRPSDNPLIIHIADVQWLERYAKDIPASAFQLAEAFWPGPLTLVLPKKDNVPAATTGGLDTVAIRMPDHPVALDIIRACDLPLAAPSANQSGKPSPTNSTHVLQDLDGRIAAVVDGGITRIGLESTVLDLAHGTPTILRAGAITFDNLKGFLPDLKTADKDHEHHSPGTRYRHYSPEAKVILCSNEDLDGLIDQLNLDLGKVGFIGFAKRKFNIHIPLQNSPKSYAHVIFSSLRNLDAKKVDYIIVEPISEEGIGVAVMDRLRKAASNSEF